MANARTPPASLGATLRATGSVFTTQSGTLLPILLAWAVLYTVLDHQVFKLMSTGSGPPSQEDLLPLAGAWMGAMLSMEILLGPILAATAIYAGRNWLTSQEGSTYGAVNFAIGRYTRMFLPHALAMTLVNLGMIIVVPGILYMMQYAFVDSVAALESKKTWALGRSKKLTRSRRRRIFMIFLPFLVYGQVAGIAAIMLQEQVGLLFVLALVQNFLALGMAIAFFLTYSERTTPVETAPAEPAKAEPAKAEQPAASGAPGSLKQKA